MIFRKIIDTVLDEIMKSEDRGETNENIVGAGLMGTYYYPLYDEYNLQQKLKEE